MKVVGSVIARLGSKRLTYKNLLPFGGVPLIGIAIRKLQECTIIDEVVVSTESELIARVSMDFGARVLYRPPELSEDNVPSIPVFQHIVKNYPCDVHVNYNCNFPVCESSVIKEAVGIAEDKGESLSVPFAVWAQRSDCLENYGDPFNITAHRFDAPRVGSDDIHTMQDLLENYRLVQGAKISGFPLSE